MVADPETKAAAAVADTSEVTGGPIFVRGLSRSGGTLMVTLLDAHPDVAMSYELYPTLLDHCDVEDGISSDEIGRRLEKASSLKQAADSFGDRHLRTFVLRCSRGGLDLADLRRILEDHRSKGHDLGTPEDRLRFIEGCCVAKMAKVGKRRWGLKCNNQYDLYRRVFPDASFLNMLRDGRDVLASQLTTGSFDRQPTALGESWSRTHEMFSLLLSDPSVRAYMVRYEVLAHEPEAEIQRICAAMGLAFDREMLSFYDQDLTIYKTSHLSMDQISKPITTSKIGRWKKDVPLEALRQFEDAAGPALQRFGYSLSTEAERAAMRSEPAAVPPRQAGSGLRARLGRLLRR